MNVKKPYIFFYLAKLPLLFLYISFFTVQLFYNFDIPAHPLNNAGALFQKNNAPENNQTGIKKANPPADQKIVFRLNKRYQPQPAATCSPVIISQLVCAISSKLHVHYSSGFTPLAFQTAHSLRGPPVV
jgi:hypothetical protein